MNNWREAVVNAMNTVLKNKGYVSICWNEKNNTWEIIEIKKKRIPVNKELGRLKYDTNFLFYVENFIFFPNDTVQSNSYRRIRKLITGEMYDNLDDYIEKFLDAGGFTEDMLKAIFGEYEYLVLDSKANYLVTGEWK